jgi:hypothetical protein
MTRADAICVMELHKEQHGVCGIIGSLDCTHSGCLLEKLSSGSARKTFPLLLWRLCVIITTCGFRIIRFDSLVL